LAELRRKALACGGRVEGQRTPGAARPAEAALLPGRADARLLEALLHLLELGRRRRVDLADDGGLLFARLDLRPDLRDDARLMDGREDEPGRDRLDAGEGGHALRLILREGELRPRQEEVMDEVAPGLPELRQVGDDRLVRLDQVAAATSRPEREGLVLLG